MTDHNLHFLGLALVWGGALGFVYFGGLWWTLCGLPGKSRPRSWLAFSLFSRILLVLMGFWIILRVDLVGFFVTLASFFLMRAILIRKLGPSNGRGAHEH